MNDFEKEVLAWLADLKPRLYPTIKAIEISFILLCVYVALLLFGLISEPVLGTLLEYLGVI